MQELLQLQFDQVSILISVALGRIKARVACEEDG